MTTKEFCAKYGIDPARTNEVIVFINTHKEIPTRTNALGFPKIDEKNADALYAAWKSKEDARQESARRWHAQYEQEEALLREDQERVDAVAAAMPITSTNGFDGYRITEYGGYVSGDEVVVLTSGFFGIGNDFKADRINDKIVAVRKTAIKELKFAAAEIGCNAVVGLDFDYVTIDRQMSDNTTITFLVLTANGTAVTIERA